MRRPAERPVLGLYIHIPFCKAKCAYCDFYSLAHSEEKMDAYMAALLRHLEEVAPRAAGMQVDTVYFGGGTPSYLGVSRLTRLLQTVLRRYDVARGAEITLEANPDSAGDWKELRRLRRAGFNRLSLGVQSTDDALLRRIGRIHTYEQVQQAVTAARKAGFRNISIFDDDVVSIENIGPQAHNLCDIGLPKVEAVRRAGIAARGVEIAAYNRRVHSLGDIREALGYTPDILITCTDSAEFRNGFITGLASAFRHDAPQEYATGTSYPDLLLDYRMSLGDWTCYAIPLRIMRRVPRQSMLAQYCSEAVFPPEEAVQESCTERAIVYTGASVASYTGAFLHWWFTGGKASVNENLAAFFDSGDTELPMHWTCTHSSRDWEAIQPTRRELRLLQKRHSLYEEQLLAEQNLRHLLCAEFYLNPEKIKKLIVGRAKVFEWLSNQMGKTQSLLTGLVLTERGEGRRLLRLIDPRSTSPLLDSENLCFNRELLYFSRNMDVAEDCIAILFTIPLDEEHSLDADLRASAVEEPMRSVYSAAKAGLSFSLHGQRFHLPEDMSRLEEYTEAENTQLRTLLHLTGDCQIAVHTHHESLSPTDSLPEEEDLSVPAQELLPGIWFRFDSRPDSPVYELDCDSEGRLIGIPLMEDENNPNEMLRQPNVPPAYVSRTLRLYPAVE